MKPDELLKAASVAAGHAYAPYSRYRVGAAVLTESGSVYTGSNVENRSYGLTVCAERVAIFKAISAGEDRVAALAVFTEDGAMPCGACRQVLFEFGTSTAMVYVKREGHLLERSLSDLLPEAFE